MSEIISTILSKDEYTYAEILSDVQAHMSENQKELINQIKTDFTEKNPEQENKLKDTIEEYIFDNNIKCDTIASRETLINKLFDSMVRFDFLTPYILDDEFIIENGIEEINANAWNEIYITDKNGVHLSEEHFCSPEQAITIVSSIATRLDKTLNEGTPIFLGEIKKNIRIACASVPVVDSKKVVNFSIRIVSIKEFTKEELVEENTYSNDSLTLLETLVENGVSVLLAGATNSGKTATMNYLLKHLTKDGTRRTGTIEIEAREFDLPVYDENSLVQNNTFSWVTRESLDEEKDVDANTLEELMMRFSPQIIGVGEMRNKEAMITCEIATTGHTVITTTHSKNAASAYDRVVMLCKKAQLGYDDTTLYRLALEAFPVIAFQRFFNSDRKRVCTEVVEGVGYENGKVITRTLYKFVRDLNNPNETVGHHERVNNISENLIGILYDNGASTEDIRRITK